MGAGSKVERSQDYCRKAGPESPIDWELARTEGLRRSRAEHERHRRGKRRLTATSFLNVDGVRSAETLLRLPALLYLVQR
jgi:hypothetical protein